MPNVPNYVRGLNLLIQMYNVGDTVKVYRGLRGYEKIGSLGVVESMRKLADLNATVEIIGTQVNSHGHVVYNISETPPHVKWNNAAFDGLVRSSNPCKEIEIKKAEDTKMKLQDITRDQVAEIKETIASMPKYGSLVNILKFNTGKIGEEEGSVLHEFKQSLRRLEKDLLIHPLWKLILVSMTDERKDEFIWNTVVEGRMELAYDMEEEDSLPYHEEYFKRFISEGDIRTVVVTYMNGALEDALKTYDEKRIDKLETLIARHQEAIDVKQKAIENTQKEILKIKS